MKKMKTRGMLIGLFALLFTLVLVSTSVLPTMAGGNVTGAGRWTVMTYGDEGDPIPAKAKPLPGGGVYFDFLNTPDRAMLLTDSPSYKNFLLGNLTGKTISAHIAIEAIEGATFNYWPEVVTGERPANVRFYFQKANAPGCPPSSEFHEGNPCESQYWWSNPVSIDLEDLASYGNTRTLISVPLDPAYWSDRDGHFGDNNDDYDHKTYFDKTVKNVNKIGLSFGGDGYFAFGCGVDTPFTARFKLYDFVAELP